MTQLMLQHWWGGPGAMLDPGGGVRALPAEALYDDDLYDDNLHDDNLYEDNLDDDNLLFRCAAVTLAVP